MRPLISPHLIDINTPHSQNFRYDCAGSSDETCLMMCFRTPIQILTRNGVEIGEPGCCILHSLDFRQHHCGIPGAREGFRNDWLKVDFAAIAPAIAEFELPFDTLLPTGRPDLLEPNLSAIRSDLENPDAFSEYSIRLHLRLMLLGIRRAHDSEMRRRTEMTSCEREYYPHFQKIRERMRREFHQEFHIATLAAEINLSPERFAALYRKFFGNSPYAELIDARLLAARRLLSTTSLPIKKIATLCGWSDQYYFSRLFRERFAMPPQKFRKRK